MTYYNFIKKDKNYLKSVRFIKDHVSFDMSFPKTWDIKKEHVNNVDMIENESSDTNRKIISFVTEVNEQKVDIVEEVITKIIKFNIEREEKEKLFRNKVQELKDIFSKQKLEELKNLKFDVDDISSILNDDKKSEDGRDTEGTREVEIREGEEQKQS